jgi:hypothetical protein
MKKVPAVAQVHVSLNNGMTVLDLKPGNTLTLAALRQIIKNNGFVPKEASVVAHGQPDPHGAMTFVVSGTGERLSLAATAQATGEDWTLAVLAPDKAARK